MANYFDPNDPYGDMGYGTEPYLPPPVPTPEVNAAPALSPTTPSPTANPTAPAYTLGSGMTNQFASAFYPGASIVDGKLVGGNIAANGQSGAADFLNSLWDPYSKGNYQKFFETYRGPNAASNPAALKSLLGPLSSLGWHGNPNAAGDITDFTLPNGDVVDPLINGGAGGWAWQVNPKGGGAGGDALKAATATGEKFSYPYFEPPAFDSKPFNYDAWQEPTADSFHADPGYEFARNEGLRAATNDASAKGLRRTGGFLKGLEAYGTGLADQAFGNYRNRSFQGWSANRDAALDKWRADYNVEADKFNRAESVYNTNYGTAAGSAGINLGANNSRFGQLLSLYDLSRPKVPAPSGVNPAQFGFNY